MTDDSWPHPIWINGILFVPVVDPKILQILKGAATTDGQDPFSQSNLAIDAFRRIVSFEGREARLTRIEFAILTCLIKAQGEAVPVVDILTEVWGWSAGVGSAELVRIHIRNIRVKLRFIGAGDTVLRNVRGHGYQFRTRVQKVQSSCPSVVETPISDPKSSS